MIQNRWKKILFILFISTLFVGCAFAANSVNDFKVNDAYKHIAGNDYYSLNMNNNKDVGFTVYKNADNDAYGMLMFMIMSYMTTVGITLKLMTT